MIRIKKLDGLRGLAILMVVLFHYITEISESLPVDGILNFVSFNFRLGWIGVDLFFMLSAYLVTFILLKNINSNSYFKVFFLRRFFRIVPLYLFILLSFIVLNALVVSPTAFWLFTNEGPPLWSYFLFVQNTFSSLSFDPGPHWLSVTWSLALEEQFYIFISLVLYFVSMKRVKILFMVLLIASPLFKKFLPYPINFLSLPGRIDSFMFGSLFAILCFESHLTRLIQYRKWIYIGATLLSVLSFAILQNIKVPLTATFLTLTMFGWMVSVMVQQKGYSLVFLKIEFFVSLVKYLLVSIYYTNHF
jgi:peptidoglycan/LPS O-acetylase OafA/YrhL